MKTVQEYINSNLMEWLSDHSISYAMPAAKMDKGSLNILYTDRFCLKIYDGFGHGFGVVVNVTRNYDESIFENDDFSLHWIFEFFRIRQTATFVSRKADQYEKNLPFLMNDIKLVLSRLNKMTSAEWEDMSIWIEKEAHKLFS